MSDIADWKPVKLIGVSFVVNTDCPSFMAVHKDL